VEICHNTTFIVHTLVS